MKKLLLLVVLWSSEVAAQSVELDYRRPGQAVGREVIDPSRITLDFREAPPEQHMLHFRIPDTPEAILKARIFDRHNRPIAFRMLLDKEEGLVLGTHQSDLKIELLHRPRAGSWTVVGRRGAEVVSLTRDDLHLTDLDYGAHCFELEKPGASDLSVMVGIAIDISGSMEGYLGEVRESLNHFIRNTPEDSQCRLVAFDHEVFSVDPERNQLSVLPARFRPCRDYAELDATRAIETREGGTELVKTVRGFYGNFADHVEALNTFLLLSDGMGEHTDEQGQISNLLDLKEKIIQRSGVYTVINWLGRYDTQSPLRNLADQSIYGSPGGVVGQDFFERSDSLVNSQMVLNLVSCEG